ncbi:MAG: RimK/LysX family protein [Alcanivoracaceae bacterium]|jgi:hypothetical protein|nr:RimK/LysX family protein [Alcanivoracaceae bacterium]
MARLLAALVVLMLVSGPAPGAEEAESRPVPKVIYGLSESVFVPELGIVLPAKVDSGAESASLSARNIQRFDRDGERWVRFRLAVPGLDLGELELPLAHNVRIKRRASDVDEDDKDYSRRPVVELVLCVGDRQALLDVNLTDRRRFSHPMLLGHEALRALRALVDAEYDRAMGAPRCQGAEDARRPQ